MKHAILAIALLGASCATSNTVSDLKDADKNLELNTTEIVANGRSWDLNLPPNFMVMDHVVKDDYEVMKSRSRFLVGNKPIAITIASSDWDKTPNEFYSLAHDSLSNIPGWKEVYGPVVLEVGTMSGYVDVGIAIDEMLVMQFAFIDEGHGYVLRCIGDANAKVRVVNRCHELLERFHAKPVGAQSTP